MSTSIRVLMVEDSPDDAALLLRSLEKHGYAPVHRRVDTRAGLLAAFQENGWDVALIDYTLPGFDGLEALEAIRSSGKSLGIVIVSGTISEETAVASLSAGAHDYVLKDNLRRLGPAVDHALREARQRVRQHWAEDELRKSEAKHRQLHQSMRDGFLSTDMEGRILESNEAFQEMVGYGAEELVARQYLDLIPEKWHAVESQVFEAQILPQGYSSVYEKEYRRKDGTCIPVEVRRVLLKDSGGRQASIWTTIREITQRKQTEEALERERTLLHTLMDSLPDIVYFKDSRGRFMLSNAAHLHALGAKSVEEVAGKLDQDLAAPEFLRLFSEGEKAVLQTGQAKINYEEKLDGADGVRWLLISMVPLRREGSIVGTACISRDITDRKSLESQLVQAQKMEAIGQLAGGVAHDFNNMLTAIIGYATYLQLKLQDDSLRRNAEQIITAAERAAQLTQGLLAFSRKQIMDAKPVDLNTVIGLMEKLLARMIGDDIDLKARLSGEQLVIMADAGQVEQILMNLATNSRDAMPDGGSIIVSTSRLVLDEAFARSHGYGKPGLYAMLSFEDTGRGIEKKDLERIFEPFFTTKEVGKGTGLGLSIVYGIVKDHGGYINVYSETGKGTTFRIYFPIVSASVTAGKASEMAPPRQGTEMILLGEDDPSVRHLTRLILEEFGYLVVEAVDGEDAVEKHSEHKDEIRLVIMDIMMPKLSGKAAADRIARQSPGTPVLYTSGYTADIIHHKGILDEGLHFITKPFSPDVLLRKVREILDQ